MDWTSSLFKNLLRKDPAGHEDRAAVPEAEEVQVLAAAVVRAVLAAVEREDHAVSTGVVRADPIAPAIVIQVQVRAVALVSCLYFVRIEAVPTIAQAIIHAVVQEAVSASDQEVVSAVVQAQVSAVVGVILDVRAEAVKVAVPAGLEDVEADVSALVILRDPVVDHVVDSGLVVDFLKTAIWSNYDYGESKKQRGSLNCLFCGVIVFVKSLFCSCLRIFCWESL